MCVLNSKLYQYQQFHDFEIARLQFAGFDDENGDYAELDGNLSWRCPQLTIVGFGQAVGNDEA